MLAKEGVTKPASFEQVPMCRVPEDLIEPCQVVRLAVVRAVPQHECQTEHEPGQQNRRKERRELRAFGERRESLVSGALGHPKRARFPSANSLAKRRDRS